MFVRCARLVPVSLAGAVLLGFASSAPARAWVDADGISFQADYVRLSGDSVVIRQDGETHVMPTRRLSADDRAWVQAAEACRKHRDWKTHRFDVIRGRYEKLEGETVFLRTRSGRRTIELRALSEADRRLITTFNEIPMVTGLAATEGGDNPFNAGNVERVWTSKSGSKIVAEYRGLEGDKIALFYKNREWRVDRSRFSAADQEYLDAHPKKTHKLMFDDLEPEEAVDADRPASKEIKGKKNNDSGRHKNLAAEVRRKMAERMKARNEDESLDSGQDYRVQVVNGKRRVWVDEVEVYGAEADRIARLLEKNEPRSMYARTTSRPNRRPSEPQHKTSLATKATTTTAERAPQPARPQQPKKVKPAVAPAMHYYECFACEKTIESASTLNVGDKCPHCGVTFDQLQNESGEVVEVSSTITTRRTISVIKLTVFGILGLGAFLGWLTRQG